jgi:hypothetical protein
MRLRQPPRVASWLLQSLGCSVDNDAVLGDLSERYREGKTRAWYWKQTLVAIAVSTFQDIQARKLLALRALTAGCLVQMSLELYFSRYFFPLVPYWVPLSWWGTGFELVVGSVISLSLGIVGGGTIVRLYLGRRAILLCYLLIVQALGMLTAVISGTSDSVYFAAGVSLTVGTLVGGFWLGGSRRVAW